MEHSDEKRFLKEHFDPLDGEGLTMEDMDLQQMRDPNKIFEKKLKEKYDHSQSENHKARYGPEGSSNPDEIFSPEELKRLQNLFALYRSGDLYKPPWLIKGQQVLDFLKKCEEADIQVLPFNLTISEIIDAIHFQTEIDGVKLYERIQDPNFRFVSSENTDESIKLSEAFALTARMSRAAGFIEGLNQGSKKGTVAAANKRATDADEFAKNLFSIVEKLKTKTGGSNLTIRGTVDKLNQEGIESPNGGKWNKSSFQLVQKRWRTLGLAPANHLK